MDNSLKHTNLIKAQAKALGFDFCGISEAGFLEDDAPKLENWLKQGHHGQMAYMENHFDMRLNPQLLVPGAKSVISLMANYFPDKDLATEDGYKIAKYAYGEDYHFVLKRQLKELLRCMQQEIGEIDGRVFVDSAPIIERSWAQKSGLGWVGKHTLLINKGHGSFFFLAEIITDLPLMPDGPIADYCGTCTRCIDACPTDAIHGAYQLDASKCISYLTIELKEAIPTQFKGQMENWVFGCDICQDVCPWNRFSHPHKTPAFAPNENMTRLDRQGWEDMTEEVFREIFKNSPVKRTKYEGLQRNVLFAKND